MNIKAVLNNEINESDLTRYYNDNIKLVAKYLGHTDIATTLNTYSHFYKSELDSIVNIINNKNKR